MTAPNVTRDGASWAEEWRQALGSQWRLQLWVIAALLFATGFSLPFADPDLSIHLATGEWIASHHAVPFTEPFAWTRPGAPFLAYSWSIELIYYLLIVHVGPMGLERASRFPLLALGAAMLVLGRVARWNPWVIILMAAVESHRHPRSDAVRPPAVHAAHRHSAVLGVGVSSLDTKRAPRAHSGGASRRSARSRRTRTSCFR